MTVKIFKMNNGEVVIGKVVAETVDHYVLESPANIGLQQTESGVSVGIAEYMPYAAGNVTLRYTAIASEAEPEVKLANEYNRLYGSGIVIANAGQLPK
jgi:hypothetical protein